MSRARRHPGFTLVELLVVVLIIGILAAIALPRFLGQRTRTKNAAAQAAVRHALVAARSYYTQNSESYTGLGPTQLQGYESSLGSSEPADTVKPGDAAANPQNIWIGNGLDGTNPNTVAGGDPNGGSTVVLCSVSKGDNSYCIKDTNGVASYLRAGSSTQVSTAATGSFSASGWDTAVTAGTLTVYPSFDGTLLREGVNETFNTIRSATNATTVDTTNTAYSVSYLATSTTSNQFYRLIRSIFVFDTSSLGSGATVTSATLSLYTNTAVVGYAKGDPYPGPPTIGSSNTVVVAASPASDTALQASDYSTLGSTAFGSISWAAWSAVANAENVIALNASGLAAINRTGNTRLGTTIEWDRSGSFTGTWASFTPSFVVANSRNVAGTSYDPKLVINYLR